MPQAFSDQQMQEIRQKLFDSACRHAVRTGVKTSMETLTNDAGISKSTFYKFYESKERLLLEVALHFERLILEEMKHVLHQSEGISNKERTAAAVNAAFLRFAQLGAVRFFTEDLPVLIESLPLALAKKHLANMSESVLKVLTEEGIRFCVPQETVLSLIQLLYRSVPAIAEVDHFVEAFRLLVLGACNQVVESSEKSSL